MTNKKEKLKELSASLRNRTERIWTCERGIEHHLITSPYFPQDIHIEIISHPDQLL